MNGENPIRQLSSTLYAFNIQERLDKIPTDIEKANYLISVADALESYIEIGGYYPMLKVLRQVLQLNSGVYGEIAKQKIRFWLLHNGLYSKAETLFERAFMKISDKLEIPGENPFLNKKLKNTIRSVSEFQSQYLDKAIEQFSQLQKYYIENVDALNGANKILIEIDYFIPELDVARYGRCRIEESQNLVLEFKACGHVRALEFRQNRADVLSYALEKYSNAAMLRIVNLWQMDGTEEVSQKQKYGTILSHEEKVEILKNHREFGILRDENKIGVFYEDASFMKTTFDFLQPDLESCHRQINGAFRKLNFGFLCNEHQVGVARNLLGAINSRSIYSHEDDNGGIIHFDFARLEENPINDLKVIFPNKFDQCGNAKELEYPTLFGLFPDGNALQFIYKGSKCD